MTDEQPPADRPEINIVQAGNTTLFWMLLLVVLSVGWVGYQLTALNVTLRETDPYYIKRDVCLGQDGEISQNTQGNLVCDVRPYARTTDNQFQFDNGDFVIL